MVVLWVSSILEDTLKISVSLDDTVGTVKDKLSQIFESKGVLIPQAREIVVRGVALKNHTKLSDVPLKDGDHCILLYDLRGNEKLKDLVAPSAPVQAPAPSPAPAPQAPEVPSAPPQPTGTVPPPPDAPPEPAASTEPEETGSEEDEEQDQEEENAEAQALGEIGDFFENVATLLGAPPPVVPSPDPSVAQTTAPSPAPPTTAQEAPGAPAQPARRNVAETTLSITEFLQYIPFPENELQFLISMGFPEWRCRKALLLNHFDTEAALEWIITNENSPELDSPLNPNEIRALFASLQNYLNQDEEEEGQQVTKIEDLLKECIKNKKCTFTVTQREYSKQKWFHCYTCGLIDSEGVCEACAGVCHKNHKLSDVKESSFFCDCGSGAYKCICNK
eukprot:TRINITY_DN14251_c0_g1_i1.p1 TRINITY_DN14251_c0_g1~~TRINITY_DN14251_c0_g1_i1.p1  ORF type:complete len:391 (-),score=114.00 TRINITY_DN14251_c0_g1_i1:52-1224(-)